MACFIVDHNRMIYLSDESATLDIGKKLASVVTQPLVVFLDGDLGAGKTTLVRGFLRGFGYEGVVKSPTYTLVEAYTFPKASVYHFDLYRLAHPEALEFIGIREYFDDPAIVLIEWPEQGKGFLPEPDVTLHLTASAEGRMLAMQGLTERGALLLKGIQP